MNSLRKAAVLRNSHAPNSWCGGKHRYIRRCGAPPCARAPQYVTRPSPFKTASASPPLEAGLEERIAKDRNRIVPLSRTSRFSSPLRGFLRKTALNGLVLAAVLAFAAPRLAHAEAHLLIEADTGKVLEAENATIPWYPASVTKIMTAYVTLKAVKDGKITLDTLFTVSPLAASQSPSKMGFRPGTQLTVDNALKMMLVKSANDMAVVLAEGVGGSIDGFSARMNDTA